MSTEKFGKILVVDLKEKSYGKTPKVGIFPCSLQMPPK